MISLMQEDTRKAKEHGAENLTIGYFVMKVTLLKTAINYLGEIFSFLNMQTIFVRISQIFVILGFVLMPISPYLRDDCQLIFSATMFVYVFLTAILPPTCACPSVCVIIIGVRLQCVSVSVFLFVCVFLCLSALWFPRLVIFLAFNLTILYCFRLSVCVFTCLSDCLSIWYRSTFTYVCSVLSRLVIFCPFLPALSLIVSPLGGREQKVSVTYDV